MDEAIIEAVAGIITVALPVINFVVARKKDRNPWIWLLLNFVLPIVSTMIVLVIKPASALEKPVQAKEVQAPNIDAKNMQDSDTPDEEDVIEYLTSLQNVVNTEKAQAIQAKFPTREHLKQASMNEITSVMGVGKVTAKKLRRHMRKNDLLGG